MATEPRAGRACRRRGGDRSHRCVTSATTLCVSALALASLWWAPAEPARSGTDTGGSPTLRAGLGVAPLPAPIGGPLGGYGGLFDRDADSIRDAPEARALVLESERNRIALVALDVVIVRPELRDPIAAELVGDAIDGLVVVATHTHSGPGGYIDAFLAERLTAGSFRADAPTELAAAATRAIRRAIDDLRPVTAAAGETTAAFAANRRYPDGDRETALPLLLLAPQDGLAPIAVVSFGAHPTVLGPASHAYSADYVGALRSALEERGVRPLFLPGPMGDQRPVLEDADALSAPEVVAELGAGLAQRAATLLDGSLRPAVADLALSELELALPVPTFRRYCALWWLEWAVGASARRLLPREVPFQALRVGDAVLAMVPAEPSSRLGEQIRGRLRALWPGSVPFVVAHANAWAGYVLTADRYEEGGYESCLSFHGPGFGARLVDAAELAAIGLPADPP